MRDRDCKQIFAALSQYLDGELPVKNCRELERHIRGCKPCLAYIENLKTTIQACRSLGVAKLPRPSARLRAAFRKAAMGT
jgi:RNA polymerase sigma-70 factor (ECF subfamily)